MPQLGEIRKAKELGYTGSGKYIWHACEGCGKQRWVLLRKGKLSYHRCMKCVQNDPLLKQKRSEQRGEKSHYWKGGRIKDDRGYIRVLLQPEDFFYPMSEHHHYVMEHRLVMAQSLGRCLRRWEFVHHKNGVKDDNRLDNLELTSSLGEHSANHSKGYRDGYAKGYQDGKDKRIKELEAEINVLKESGPCSS